MLSLFGVTGMAAVVAPLPALLPGSAAGAWSYSRRGKVDWQVARRALLGAFPATVVGAVVEPLGRWPDSAGALGRGAVRGRRTNPAPRCRACRPSSRPDVAPDATVRDRGRQRWSDSLLACSPTAAASCWCPCSCSRSASTSTRRRAPASWWPPCSRSPPSLTHAWSATSIGSWPGCSRSGWYPGAVDREQSGAAPADRAAALRLRRVPRALRGLVPRPSAGRVARLTADRSAGGADELAHVLDGRTSRG